MLRFGECMQIMKPPFSPSSSIIRNKGRFSTYLFTLLAFIIFVTILYGEDFMCIFGQQLQNYSNQDKIYSTAGKFIPCFKKCYNCFHLIFFILFLNYVVFWGVIYEKERVKKHVKVPFAVGKTEEGCDIFSGRWVWDEVSRPLYEESECPYIQPQLTCQEHGRPDKDYQHWRWQPHGCDLPK